MIWEAWATLAVIAVMMIVLIKGLWPTEITLLGAMTAMVVLEQFSPGRFLDVSQAASGFGNSGLVTIGFLFVIVAGLKRTGAISRMVAPLLGKPRSVVAAQLRMMIPLATVSPFINNTPVVATFLPVVTDWCRRINISPSRLFIPLSYATVLGGMVTLIGTSTNLVVYGLWQQWNAQQSHAADATLSMFTPAWVGIPCVIIGIAYLVIAGRWLLPDRQSALGTNDVRQYTVEMIVDTPSVLQGQSIEQAGLRHLPGLYLVEIDRNNEILPAVSGREKLHAGDRLIFVGIVESVVDLQRIRGLSPATDQVFRLDAPRSQRRLIEAVVSDTCPLVGRTIREGHFRSTYNAAVIAVARSGKRLAQKIGDIVLRPGDTLLLEAHPSFASAQRNNRDFYLVNLIDDSAPHEHQKAWLAITLLAAMIVLVTTGVISMLLGAMLAAVLTVATGCCNTRDALRSVDWNVLVMIAAALGVGAAVQNSTLAQSMAGHFISLGGGNPWVVLIVVYLTTLLFTEIVTNNAAAVLVFPIAMTAAGSLGVNPLPFVMAVMIGASAGFATPLGYQTHLMVYGPGGYRFTDFLKIGLPLDFLMAATALVIIPLVWPLS